jgi:hypothetical protein
MKVYKREVSRNHAFKRNKTYRELVSQLQSQERGEEQEDISIDIDDIDRVNKPFKKIL